MAGSAHDEQQIAFLVTLDDSSAGGEKGLFGSRVRNPEVRAIGAETIRKNFRSTLEALREIFGDLNEVRAGLPLREVQLSFEITASGKVVILGTGAEVAGKGAITLTFGE